MKEGKDDAWNDIKVLFKVISSLINDRDSYDKQISYVSVFKVISSLINYRDSFS